MSDNFSDFAEPKPGCFERMQAMKLASSSLTNSGAQALETTQSLQSLIGVIIAFGIIANAMNIIVFANGIMRQFSMNCFLLAIAVADLLILIIQFPQSLEATSSAFRKSHEYGFRQYAVARYGLSYILMTCSVWLLAAMVTEKLLRSKLNSMNRNQHTFLTSNKVVHIVIAVVCVICTVVHVTKFAEFKPNPNLFSPTLVQKTPLAKNQVYEVYLYIVNIILSVIVPVLILIIAASFFLYKLIKFGFGCKRTQSLSNNESLVNLLMFCLSVCYIIFHAIAIYFMFKTILPMKTNPFSVKSMGILRTINEFLILSYVAFKFLIYLFFVQHFKDTLKDRIMCKRSAKYRLPPDGNTQDVTLKRIPSDEDNMGDMCETSCSFENPVYGKKPDD